MAVTFTPEEREQARAMRKLAREWTGRQIDKGIDGPVPEGRKDPSDYNQHVPFLESDGADLDEFYERANKIMGITAQPVAATAGHDVTPGHDQLHHYWTRGEGLARWAESPEPWTTLEHLLEEHVNPEMAKRLAASFFHDVFHYWPGADLNRVAHGHPPRGHRVGPG